MTKDDKDKVKKAVEDANKDSSGNSTLPEGATIDVADDGTVTIKDKTGKEIGKITADKTVAQNANKLGVKAPEAVEVANPENVTTEEQGKIKEAVKKANPDLNLTDDDITVDEKGNVTVTKDGKTGKLTPEQTVKELAKASVNKDELTKLVESQGPTKNADKYKKADQALRDAYDRALAEAKEVLANPNASQEDVDKAKDALEKAQKALNGKADDDTNPAIPPIDAGTGSDNKGGSGDADEDKPGQAKGDEDSRFKPIDKVGVKDPSKLTDAEKKAIADRIRKNNPGLIDISVDDQGRVVIITKDGRKITIPAKDVLFKAEDERVILPKDKVKVKDVDKLSKAEKKAILDSIKKANPDAKKVEMDKNGNLVLTYKDGYQAKVSYKNLVEKAEDGSVAVPTNGKEGSANPHRGRKDANQAPQKSGKEADQAPARDRQNQAGAKNVKTGVGAVSGLFGIVGAAIAGLFATRKKEDK